MSKNRVVVTGMGAVSPFGQSVDTMFSAMQDNMSAIRFIPELESIEGINTKIAGLVPDLDYSLIPRKNRRSMSKMSLMAILAAQEAIAQATLTDELKQSPKTGLVVGSTLGSPYALEEFFGSYIPNKSIEQIKSMVFFKVMGHSIASNIAQYFDMQGRVMAPTAACATGCQAIGIAYELIRDGVQHIVICGGADEYHPLTSATFDMMQAASTGYNDTPETTPRPFDSQRDGIVCSEGAGILILESLDSAQRRNAPILAEIVGFSTRSNPSNIASPDSTHLYNCMAEALEQQQIDPHSIDYINAHATGTMQGDLVEAAGIAKLVGKNVPVSSLKGYLGHTMAASGALETIACIQMLRYNILLGTRNLKNIAPDCQNINVLQKHESTPANTILKNSFALGGINCSLVLRKV